LTLDVDYDKKRIPHLNNENIKKYLNSRLFNFKNDLFYPPDIQTIKLDDYHKVPIEDLREISLRDSQNKAFKKIAFNFDLKNTKKIYFLDIHGEFVGYSISQNNFKYINSKENKFVGIIKGNDLPTHILY
jgi:hypothetical protein